MGALDGCWHHFLGRVSMYLEIISSITSSAPAPIDINLPSLQEEQRYRRQTSHYGLHWLLWKCSKLTCRTCWPARRWWSPFLPRTAGSCRSLPWPGGRPLAWPWTPAWSHRCLWCTKLQGKRKKDIRVKSRAIQDQEHSSGPKSPLNK